MFPVDSILWFAALSFLPAVAAALTLFNLMTWPRGRAGGSFEEDVSVLIPARNEADSIDETLRSVVESDADIREILVYDDRSTDGTRERVEAWSERDERVRVIEGRPLPEGWVGKPHACHRLAREASGEVLVFLDADTRILPGGFGRLADLMARWPDIGLFSAVPRQETVHVAERLIIPLLHLTYTSWLPLPLVWKTDDPRLLAANGQVMAVRRASLEAVGGFASVRGAVVDDMALCRRFKRAGEGVLFADGFEMATCRMYTSASEIWEGFSKNLYEGIGGHPLGLLGVVALYLAAFVLPYVLLFLAALGTLTAPVWASAAATGVGLNLLLRAALVWRFRQPIEGIVLHPVAVVALVVIAVNSWVWSTNDAIQWAGRTYQSSRDGGQR
jgi:chlorobactene glucosyltransferase